MKDSSGFFQRHRRAVTAASLGMAALALVACGSEDDEAEPTEEPTAPVEETVATNEPSADEATQVATAAMTEPEEGASPAADDGATPAMEMDEASPVAEVATPVEAMGDADASPEAATHAVALDEATPAGVMDESTPAMATPEIALDDATPIGAIATPAEEVLDTLEAELNTLPQPRNKRYLR